MTGPVVCLVNRTSRNLTITKNGRQTTITPGDNWINSDLVRFAKQQNLMPGTKSPNDLSAQYLVGVRAKKGDRQLDPIDPISDEEINAMPSEAIDRSQLPMDRQLGVAEVRGQGFPRGRVAPEGAGPIADQTDFGGR